MNRLESSVFEKSYAAPNASALEDLGRLFHLGARLAVRACMTQVGMLKNVQGVLRLQKATT